MNAIQGGIQSPFDMPATWRDAYLLGGNQQQQRAISPPVSRSGSPADSLYCSLSEGHAFSSASSSEAAAAAAAPVASGSGQASGSDPAVPSRALSQSSISSMFTLPDREDKFGFIYDYDRKTQGIRVNRRGLETLMVSVGPGVVASLFVRVMTMTNTLIHWPENLQQMNEDNDKEDPFIRIVGSNCNIARAKRLIVENFLAEGQLIKLQMSIPKCDRSSIVGGPADWIMGSTRTGINFEEAHHSGSTGNHRVDIYGSIISVEQARQALRLAVPFIIGFDMHLTRGVQDVNQTPFVQQLEASHNVRVKFSLTNTENVYEVLVEGTEHEARKVKEAVRSLSKCPLGGVLEPVYRLTMTVSKDTLDIFTADKSAILKRAMAHTDTEIEVVEPTEDDDMSTKLIISGTVPDIQNAQRELAGYIPIELVFEVDNDDQDVDKIQAVADKYVLQLMLQPRDDLNVLCVTLRGSERYVHDIYDAHQDVMYLQAKADQMCVVSRMAPFMNWPPAGDQDNLMMVFDSSPLQSSCWLNAAFPGLILPRDRGALECRIRMETPTEEVEYLNIQLPPLTYDLCMDEGLE